MRKAITPKYQHESTFYGLAKAAGDSTQSASSNPVGTYTDEAKTAIQQMLGVPSNDDIPDVPVQDVQVNGTSVVTDGVANVPVATTNGRLGLVQMNSLYGIAAFGNGFIGINKADANMIKAGTENNRPIVPSNHNAAAFYGLAKAAGDTTQSASSNAVGTYTETAKSKISDMLFSPVPVTGTTPTITALSGIQYVCGEVSTLDIVLPASGIVDVVFESGSTPTVLTVNPPTGVTVKWANGFDPTALEANTTYELNIKDGLGVAGAWS